MLLGWGKQDRNDKQVQAFNSAQGNRGFGTLEAASQQEQVSRYTNSCVCSEGRPTGHVVAGSIGSVALAASLLATYCFFLGGGFTTIAFLPGWIQMISLFNPFRYAIDGLRQALFYPDLTGFATDITVLVATAIVSVILGSFAVRRSWNGDELHSRKTGSSLSVRILHLAGLDRAVRKSSTSQ